MPPSSGRIYTGRRSFLTNVRAAGDYLWLCPKHHREFEPGLPELDGSAALRLRGILSPPGYRHSTSQSPLTVG